MNLTWRREARSTWFRPGDAFDFDLEIPGKSRKIWKKYGEKMENREEN
jgi:hypothetical protein